MMRFRGLDLNLLVALDALLATRSVSRAAERLNLSQPAMSAALGRLRDYLGDEILTVRGKRMFPTAFAESLSPQLRDTLHGIDVLISTPTQFDPETSQRTFRIAASDYISVVALAPLSARLAKTAPGITLETIYPNEDSQSQLDEGKIDLMLTPENFIHRDHPADLLFEEQHVIVGWDRNPVFDRTITEDQFYRHGHITVAIGALRVASFADRHLELRGRQRNIEVTTPSFTMVPWLLRGTMRLALMHERLAEAMAEIFPIRHVPLPFPFPTMREMAQYHHARESDRALTWLRQQLAAIIRGR